MSDSRAKRAKSDRAGRGFLSMARDNGTIVNGAANPLGKTYSTTLRFCADKILLSTAGQYQEFTWNMNSLYDPDGAFGGEQPLGLDQWHAFYEYATVTASRIKVVVQQDKTDIIPCMVGLNILDFDGVSSTDPANRRMQPNSAVIYIGGEQGSSSNTLGLEVDVAQFFGKTPSQLVGVEEYSTQKNSHAGMKHFLSADLWCAGKDGVTDLRIYCAIHIEYDVTFSGPVPLPTSA